MYLCDFANDYRVNGRRLYYDLCLSKTIGFADFYVSAEDMSFDKTGKNSADLDFYIDLTNAIIVCKRYLPESNSKRVLLKLQRYRREQLKELESGYYTLRNRVKELESELDVQKSLVKVMEIDVEKVQLADAFLKSDSCVTAKEFNTILRQNGLVKTCSTTVYKAMEHLDWIDDSCGIKHQPTSYGIDHGYVRLEQDVPNIRTWQYAPVVITARGQAELFKYFKKASRSKDGKKDGEM